MHPHWLSLQVRRISKPRQNSDPQWSPSEAVCKGKGSQGAVWPVGPISVLSVISAQAVREREDTETYKGRYFQSVIVTCSLFSHTELSAFFPLCLPFSSVCLWCNGTACPHQMERVEPNRCGQIPLRFDQLFLDLKSSALLLKSTSMFYGPWHGRGMVA